MMFVTYSIIILTLGACTFTIEMPSYKKLEETVPNSCILNLNTDEQLDCVGYRKNIAKTIAFYAWSVLNIGFPLLLIRWKPEWSVWWKCSRCSIALADYLLLKNAEKQYFAKKVEKTFLSKIPHEFVHFMWSSTSQLSGDVDEEEALTLNQHCFFKHFTHQEIKYVWDHRFQNFLKLTGYEKDTLCSDFFTKFKGYSEDQQCLRSNLFGRNVINIEVKSYRKLLIEEVLNPFYIFQVFSIILWSNDDYYYFAGCIFVVSAISISVSLYKTRKQSETLHEMVSATSSSTVTVQQKFKVQEVPSSSLVPGDIIIIPQNGCIMNCDAVLVAGNCIVNESMLTGESVPVTKTPLLFQEGEFYNPSHHKRHTLFCGTKVIQTRYYEGSHVSAVVVRTGFNTAKGELVRAILYPKPIDFKFYRDAIKFIGVLSLIATVGMVYALAIFIEVGADVGFIIKRVLDIVTIVVPPSLPAAMTVGSVYAQNRLKTKKIFCISPNRINVAGKLSLFCFDKTGTLTEDGLDIWGIVPVANKNFQPLLTDPANLQFSSPFLAAMATCHSLTTINGELTGDPLDLKTFEFTRWALFELQKNHSGFNVHIPTVVRPTAFDYRSTPIEVCLQETKFKPEYEIGIVRQFPFSSTLQMMSVITRTLGNDHMDLYAKGAPEKIASLCLSSTIPENFNELLHAYTVQGFRVIALAWKELDRKLTWHHSQRIKRHELEKDLIFLGLAIMQNALKKETTPVIDILNAAKIRTVMITGDNMNTAISVSRTCRMIGEKEQVFTVSAAPPNNDHPAQFKVEAVDHSPGLVSDYVDNVEINLDDFRPKYHYATEGKSFSVLRKYFPDLLTKLAIRGTIFARMTPDQKTQLIELFQEQGYGCGFVGDGANDCGALKAAHVGISLSESEASVAAPFTSKVPNIECVIHVIQEGRCALVTSFSVFKFMALYSIIQFISVLILYSYHNDLGDTQFLFIDLIIATSLAVTMAYTASFEKLSSARPHGTLLGPSTLTSIFLQIIVASAFQVAAFVYLTHQTWYVPTRPVINVKYTASFDTTIIFCLSTFQYLAVSVAISKGKPFRKPIYTNVPFLISLIILTVFCIILLICPGPWFEDFFQMVHEKNWSDWNFRVMLLSFAAAHVITSFAIEYFVETITFKRVSHFILRKKHPKHLYKILQKKMLESPVNIN